jgi:hypothetical protein
MSASTMGASQYSQRRNGIGKEHHTNNAGRINTHFSSGQPQSMAACRDAEPMSSTVGTKSYP